MAFEQGIMTQATTQIFDDNAQTVTLYRAAKTESNLSGTAEISYGDATSITLTVMKTDASFDWNQTGLDEYGTYFIMDKPSNNNLAKDDKIVVGDETIIIQDVLTWTSRGTDIYVIASGIKEG